MSFSSVPFARPETQMKIFYTSVAPTHKTGEGFTGDPMGVTGVFYLFFLFTLSTGMFGFWRLSMQISRTHNRVHDEFNKFNFSIISSQQIKWILFSHNDFSDKTCLKLLQLTSYFSSTNNAIRFNERNLQFPCNEYVSNTYQINNNVRFHRNTLEIIINVRYWIQIKISTCSIKLNVLIEQRY